jgi:RNA polymerase sigma factor (sigma-70 family)
MSESVERVVREHGDALVRLAMVLCGDRDEAQDIVQTVLARLLGRGADLPQAPLPYVRRAVTNEFLDRTRRTSRLRGLLVVLRGDRLQHDGPEPAAGERDTVRRILAQLSPRERAAVVLRYYEDLSDAEIGEVLGCAPATTRTLLSRAMPKLRAALRAATPDGSSR